MKRGFAEDICCPSSCHYPPAAGIIIMGREPCSASMMASVCVSPALQARSGHRACVGFIDSVLPPFLRESYRLSLIGQLDGSRWFTLV